MIRVDIAYNIDDEHLDTHVSILKRSGAEIFVFEECLQTQRKSSERRILNGILCSSRTLWLHRLRWRSSLRLGKRLGRHYSRLLEGRNDPALEGEHATNDWQAFVGKYIGPEAKTTVPPSSATRPPRHWPRY